MSCYCHTHDEEAEEAEYYGYDEFNGYNAEDEGEDTELDEPDEDTNAIQRDEYIYTHVFNNHKIPTQLPMDLRMGSVEDWNLTCSTFNNANKGLMFATIYIVYDHLVCDNMLVCDNIHPFLEVNNLTDLFHAHVIHDWKIRQGGDKYC